MWSLSWRRKSELVLKAAEQLSTMHWKGVSPATHTHTHRGKTVIHYALEESVTCTTHTHTYTEGEHLSAMQWITENCTKYRKKMNLCIRLSEIAQSRAERNESMADQKNLHFIKDTQKLNRFLSVLLLQDDGIMKFLFPVDSFICPSLIFLMHEETKGKEKSLPTFLQSCF